MTTPSDPMQGFLDQLLRDWESGGAPAPAAPARQAKSAPAPGATVVPTPGVASVIRALPELSEAVALSAVEQTPPPPPPVAETVIAVRQVEPEAPFVEPEPAEPVVSWIPAAEPVAAKPPFQWPTEPPPPPAAAAKAKSVFEFTPAPPPAVEIEAEVALPPPPPVSLEPAAKPAFQWRPAPAVTPEQPAADPLASTATDLPKPAFQWRTAPTPPPPAEEATAEAPKPAFLWKPAPPPPAAAASSTPSSTPPALADFAAALSALKASRAIPPPAPPVFVPEPVAEAMVEPEAVAEDPEPIAAMGQTDIEIAFPESTGLQDAPPPPEAVVEVVEEEEWLEPAFDFEEEESVAGLHLAGEQAALLESLLAAQTGETEERAWTGYDWGEDVPVAEPAPAAMDIEEEARLEQPEVEPEVAAAAPEAEAKAEAEAEEVAAPEAAVETEEVAEVESVVEAGIEAAPDAELEEEAEAKAEVQPMTLLEPAVALDQPEWEEIAVPPVADAGPDLAAVVAGLETDLPAARDDASAAGQRVELRRHLVFAINDERFAVNLDNLVEIDNMPNWTGIPGLPSSVRGLINLRGEIVSLLELRAILGLPYPEIPRKGKIFVATTADRQAMSAFAVDEIEGIVGFDPARMKPVPPLTSAKVAKSITATVEDGDRLVRILDVGSVLTEVEQAFSLDQIWM